MKAMFVLTLTLVITPCVAFATAKSDLAAIDARLKTCIDRNASNSGMVTCTGEAYEAADKILNSIYNAAVSNLKKPTKDAYETRTSEETLKRVIASERAWISYRDADCALQGANMLGGSGEGLVTIGCRFSMTKARAVALDEFFREQ